MKFDKYWVASWFVRSTTYRPQASQSLASVLVIGLLFLLAFVSPASSATPEGGEVPGGPKVEIPTSPTTVSAETPAEPTAEAPAPAPIQVQSTVGQVAQGALDKAADTGAPLLDPVQQPPAATPVDRVREAAGSARILELTESVTESIRALSELANPAQKIDELLGLAQAPTTRVTTSPSVAPVLTVLSSPSSSVLHGDLVGPTPTTDGREVTEVAPSFLLAHAGADLSRQPLSSEGKVANGHPLPAMGRNAYSPFGDAAQRSGGHTPAEAPTPAPGSTQAAAGSAGSTFIPIAALLALLALAAPATGRRLGKAADFRPPVPFVCALERPG